MDRVALINPSNHSDSTGELRRRRASGIARNGASAFLLRAITTIATLGSYSYVARILPNGELGVWIAVTSVVSILGFADLGIGASVTTKVAELSAIGQDYRNGTREAVSSAYWLLIVCASIAAGSCATILLLTPAASTVVSGRAARDALLATCVIVAATMPFAVSGRALAGLQRGATVNLSLAAGSIISLVLLLVAGHYGGGLLALCVIGVSSTLIGQILASFIAWRDPMLRPFRHRPSRTHALELLHSGKHYFVIAISSAVAFGADSMILSATRGPRSVAEYGACYKVFTFIPIMGFLILSALWPAFAEARAASDRAWLRGSFYKSLKWSLLTNVAFAVVLLIVGKRLIGAWLGDTVEAHQSPLIASAFYAVINGLWAPIAMCLNGLGEIRFQSLVSISSAVLNVGLSIGLSVWLGAPGPIIASAISLGLATCFLYARVASVLKSPPIKEFAALGPSDRHNPGGS